jgi:hypothetical protein
MSTVVGCSSPALFCQIQAPNQHTIVFIFIYSITSSIDPRELNHGWKVEATMGNYVSTDNALFLSRFRHGMERCKEG